MESRALDYKEVVVDDAADQAGNQAGSQPGNRARQGAREVAGAAQRVQQSRTFEAVARCGFAASGLMHLLIGVLALRLALGKSGQADQSGAVAQLAKHPGGAVLLWIGFIGCLALALWQVGEVFLGGLRFEDRDRLKHRIKSVGLAIVYAAVGTTFGIYALGGSSDSGETSQDASTKLMQAPGGTVLLFLVGAGIVAGGVFYAVKGLRQKFVADLERLPPGSLGTAVRWAGIVGHVGKGAALAVVGVLVAVAALRHNPDQASGLDGALKGLREQPYGDAALFLVAVGLLCYGIYLGARARYAKM
jgi:hypothetical protein